MDAHALRRRSSPLAAGVLALAGCAYVALVDPNDPAAPMPACPTKALTGLDCPACGGLRMTRALLHGDLATAARLNVLLLLLAPVALAGWLHWLRRGGPAPTLGRVPALALLGVAAVFAVVRNLG